MWVTIIALTIMIGIVFLYLIYKNRKPKENMQNETELDDEDVHDEDIYDENDFEEFTESQQDTINKDTNEFMDKIMLAGLLMASKDPNDETLTNMKSSLMNDLTKNEYGAVIYDNIMTNLKNFVIDEAKFNELKLKYPEYSNLVYDRDVKLFV